MLLGSSSRAYRFSFFAQILSFLKQKLKGYNNLSN